MGIDAGVAKRITLSDDGRHVDRRELDRRKLRRLQRRVAREWQRIAEHNRGDEHQVAAAIDETG